MLLSYYSIHSSVTWNTPWWVYNPKIRTISAPITFKCYLLWLLKIHTVSRKLIFLTNSFVALFLHAALQVLWLWQHFSEMSTCAACSNLKELKKELIVKKMSSCSYFCWTAELQLSDGYKRLWKHWNCKQKWSFWIILNLLHAEFNLTLRSLCHYVCYDRYFITYINVICPKKSRKPRGKWDAVCWADRSEFHYNNLIR